MVYHKAGGCSIYVPDSQTLLVGTLEWRGQNKVEHSF